VHQITCTGIMLRKTNYTQGADKINSLCLFTDGEKVSDYEMKLMDLDTEHLGIPVCTSHKLKLHIFIVTSATKQKRRIKHLRCMDWNNLYRCYNFELFTCFLDMLFICWQCFRQQNFL